MSFNSGCDMVVKNDQLTNSKGLIYSYKALNK
jgi:hypothetical protein